MSEDYSDRMAYVYYVHEDDTNDNNGTMIMKIIMTYSLQKLKQIDI